MTAMPILEHILRGGRITNAADPELAKVTHDGIKRSTYFNIQIAENIADERIRRTRTFQVDENIGLLHAPYPDVFMEWNYQGRSFGCHLTEGIDLPDTTMVATLILGALPGYTTEAFAYPIQRMICLDNASHFKDWGLIFNDNLHQEPDDTDIAMSNYLLVTVVTALALINCRNVTTEPNRIGIGRSGTQKRRRETPQEIRYQTIILPGGGTQSDGKGGHRATALHRVRGHFKTFTADKPLLGQHVGTYWWGWQVRGNSDYGTIVSDYEIAGQR